MKPSEEGAGSRDGRGDEKEKEGREKEEGTITGEYWEGEGTNTPLFRNYKANIEIFNFKNKKP